MRSRSNSLEDSDVRPARRRSDAGCRSSERGQPPGRGDGRREKARDLTRDDLVFLLSLLEGELQARDEVITVLKADKVDPALLEAKYGFRDALQEDLREDVYQRPMEELDKLVQQQQQYEKRMLQQLLQLEESHQEAVRRLEDEERNHGDFMRKSDDLTNLLEHDRERLKLLLSQEKSYRERLEAESSDRATALQSELSKLKTFTLTVVDERQRLAEELRLQTEKNLDLSSAHSRLQEELSSAHSRLKEEELKASSLQDELSSAHSRLKEEELKASHLEDLSSAHFRLKEAELKASCLEEELSSAHSRLKEEELKSSNLQGKLSSANSRLKEEELKSSRLQDELSSAHSRLQEDRSSAHSRLHEELSSAHSQLHEELSSTHSRLKEEELKSSRLQEELNSAHSRLKEEELKSSHLQEELNSAHSRLKEEELKHQEEIKELETAAGLSGNSISELEELRRRVLEMEGKDEELARVEDQCGDLDRKLKKEAELSAALKREVEKLSGRMAELEQLEREFNRSREEVGVWRQSLEAEQELSAVLKQEVDTLRAKVGELEAAEGRLGQAEQDLRADLARIKAAAERSKVTEEDSVLKRKLVQQEVRSREMGRELEAMTLELERYRRVSRSLRPGRSGRRLADLLAASKAVQTDDVTFDPRWENKAAVENGTVCEEAGINGDQEAMNGKNILQSGVKVTFDPAGQVKLTPDPGCINKAVANRKWCDETGINGDLKAENLKNVIESGVKVTFDPAGQVNLTPDPGYNNMVGAINRKLYEESEEKWINGDLEAVNGNHVKVTFDPAGQINLTSDPRCNSPIVTFDPAGHVKLTPDPGRNNMAAKVNGKLYEAVANGNHVKLTSDPKCNNAPAVNGNHLKVTTSDPGRAPSFTSTAVIPTRKRVAVIQNPMSPPPSPPATVVGGVTTDDGRIHVRLGGGACNMIISPAHPPTHRPAQVTVSTVCDPRHPWQPSPSPSPTQNKIN
uniref:Cortactin-binding protein-2 N-terminal domain-containing protein n=1 Tax=Salarias fasciatus TaxID=181472 RepID=A0A672FVJ0_SALFA